MTRILAMAARLPRRSERAIAGRPECARRALLAVLFVLPAVLAAPARAQTPTSAALRGEVRGVGNAPVADARVVVVDVATGFERSDRTDRDGRFTFLLLPPGEYAVTAEKLGYRPERFVDVRLLPGRSASLTFTIGRAEPPILTVDTVGHGASTEWSRSGQSRWFGPLELGAPRSRDAAGALLSLAGSGPDAGVVEGMPAATLRVAPEGFSFGPLTPAGASRTAGSSGMSGGSLARLRGAELVDYLPHVQWEGSAAPELVTHSNRGTREWSLQAWSTGSDAQATLGRFSEDEAFAFDRTRVGGEVSGPLVADTAVFVLGGEWRRRTAVEPRAWRLDELAGARVAGAARGDAELALLGLTMPRVAESDEFGGWARLDWRVAASHDLSAFADFRAARPEAVAPLLATPARNAEAEAVDLVGGLTLRSIIGERFANELRLGFARTSAETPLPGALEPGAFAESGLPFTSVVGGALVFGASPLTPSADEHTALRLEQVMLVEAGSHTLAAGLDLDWDSREVERGFARVGAFTFGNAAAFDAGEGSFVQYLGAPPIASFSVVETAVFFQDSWRPAPGLEVTAGLRMSDERLPTDGVQPSAQWRALTGISTAPADERVRQFSPRLGIRWNVRDEGRWIVRAGIGRYHDDVAPELLAERQVLDGSARVRRAFGALGSWPALPDSAGADTNGRALTFFGPDFRPPRATRASLGMSRVGALSVHLSGTYRFTDFLPARRDLNRQETLVARDQHGRPLFAEPQQQGALLAAEPGSNRRFAAFDVVSAIEATAFSEYWGITSLVERRFGALRLAASYTFSQTRDNWLAHPLASPSDAIAPQLGESASPSGEDWAEGTSSFDVPHSFAAAAELVLPFALAPAIGVVYRASSGLPFTPGFQPGVDVNGDYASNDPAFVDDSLEGMAALLEDWECLRDQVGVFAERNSCRGPGRHALDARLGLEFGLAQYARVRVYVDALNLLARELAVPDAALYLVDPDAQIQVSDDVVTLPLVVNPGFGEPVRSIEAGRVFRIGAEVSL